MSAGLEQVQQWMMAAITHSDGISAGLARQAEPMQVDAVVRPSATLSAAQRLSIYHRSYHARLLSSFEHMFPALKHAMGERLFHRFALDYLQRHPPSSYTIDRLAENFPQYLDASRPDSALPPDQREGWCDFLCELTALEHAFLAVFDGPGLEEQRLPEPETLLALDEMRLLALRPAHAPSLCLFSLRYPVHDYLTSVRREEEPVLPGEKASLIAMTRWQYRVVIHELSVAQYILLSAVDGKRCVAELLGDEADLPTLRQWLATWTAKGLLGIPQ